RVLFRSVVDEGISMDHLNGCKEGLDRSVLSSEEAVCLQHQHRAETLAARHEAVLHRLHDDFLVSFLFRKILFQDVLDILFFLTIYFIKIHGSLHSHPGQVLSSPLHRSLCCTDREEPFRGCTAQRTSPGKHLLSPSALSAARRFLFALTLRPGGCAHLCLALSVRHIHGQTFPLPDLTDTFYIPAVLILHERESLIQLFQRRQAFHLLC